MGRDWKKKKTMWSRLKFKIAVSILAENTETEKHTYKTDSAQSHRRARPVVITKTVHTSECFAPQTHRKSNWDPPPVQTYTTGTTPRRLDKYSTCRVPPDEIVALDLHECHLESFLRFLGRLASVSAGLVGFSILEGKRLGLWFGVVEIWR